MTPVSCVPKDDFHVVLRCDGTGAILPTPCGYTKKIGTTFGDELSETISISSTIGKILWVKSTAKIVLNCTMIIFRVISTKV